MEGNYSIPLQELFDTAKKAQDENICRELFEKLRWGNNPFCPHCGSLDKIYRYKNNKLFKCVECRKQFTVTVGTVFESTHLSFSKLFNAIYHFFLSKKGLSSYHLAKIISVQQKTAWLLLQKIRYSISEDKEIMDSFYGIVEVDETYIGGKAKNKHSKQRHKSDTGRSLMTKSCVFGILERLNKRVKCYVVPNTTSETLQGIIYKNAYSGTTIVSDSHKSYIGLDRYYHHVIVNHSAGEYVKSYRAFHTNTIEGFWSNLKRGLNGVYHSVSKRYLQRYCDDYAFRYNNKKSDILDIMKLVILSSQNKRLKHYECETKLAA